MLRVHKKLGGNTGDQVTPTEQRDILYHMMSCLSIELGGKEEEGRILRVVVFVFPSNGYTW